MRATGTTPAARARVVPWPRRPDIAHVVLTDHQMVPDDDDVAGWMRGAADRGAVTARTSALFPLAAEVFARAGFTVVDTLALLELALDRPVEDRGPGRPTRRLRPSDLPRAAEIDRRAFGEEWSNDVESLDDIRNATPHHRSRAIRRDGQVVAFAISGRSGATGYVQRLAVDPGSRRTGHARALVVDALSWMARRSVGTVLVNTATDNEPALALYHDFGFRRRDEPLVLMERAVTAPAP